MLLTDAARPATTQVLALNELGQSVPTAIAAEHALTVYLDKREIVTLMTLGAAPEHLVLGYLLNQHLIDSAAAIASIQVDWSVHAAAVTTHGLQRDGVNLWEREQRRAANDSMSATERLEHRTVTSGCGQGSVFGDWLAGLEKITLPPAARLHERTLARILDAMRHQESIYRVAGAVHGCALCTNEDGAPGQSARVLRFVEDVGRHNAVDAIAGWMALNGVTGEDKIFYTTGRLTSEMVIKCAQMRIPFLLSRSGLTQMGHELARQVGMTMIGRCQGRHYLLFTGAERFVRDEAAAHAAVSPVPHD
jgi:FdhD protein